MSRTEVIDREVATRIVGSSADTMSIGRSDGFIHVTAVMFLLLWVFHYLRFDIGVFAQPTHRSIAHLIVLTIIALPVRAAALPSPFRIVLISINACCVFFIFAARETYSLGIANSLLDSAWLPVVSGILAFRYPAFMLWPALSIQWTKLNAAAEAGWGSLNGADYIIIPDLALLIVMIIGGYVIYDQIAKRAKAPKILPSVNKTVFFSAAVLVVAAVHLSNYFYSGVGKLTLPNAGPLTWVIENKTYVLSTNATDSGFITLQNIFSSSADQINFALQLFNVPMNIMVLIGQLFAVTCLLSLRKAAWTTTFYDIMHVAIFALTGIFFWKWIILNAALVYAFRRIRSIVVIPIPFRIFCCGLVVIAPMFFSIVTLAWFDTGAVNEAHFEAKAKSGETVRVPTNFFLDSSIDVAQQRFSEPYTGWLPTGTWGTTLDANLMRRIYKNCAVEAKPWVLSSRDRLRITSLLKQQKRFIGSGSDDTGRLAYDLYPHHVWSAPWMFEQFSNLDLRTISSFMLVIESRCITVNDRGHIERKEVGRAEFEFPF